VTNAEGHYQALHADAYVLALGSFSPLIAATVGMRLPIYPAKGYSATVNITRPDAAPEVSMTDEAAKVVFSRLGINYGLQGQQNSVDILITLTPFVAKPCYR